MLVEEKVVATRFFCQFESLSYFGVIQVKDNDCLVIEWTQANAFALFLARRDAGHEGMLEQIIERHGSVPLR